MVVDRFAFRAPDATGMGESSVAVSIVQAKGVTFTRVLLAAGNGKTGESGAVVPDPMWSPQEPAVDAVPLDQATYCEATSPKGNFIGDANCDKIAAGATGAPRRCPFTGPVRGGDGGDGGNYYLASDAQIGGLGVPSGDGAQDGASMVVRGFAGATALSGFGKIDDGLYVADNGGGDGRSGFRGYAGRGGPGGKSYPRSDPNPDVRYAPGGGGGQGGYPGCGGQAGKGGDGGGASIALIAAESDVQLLTCTIATGRGGDGGDGSDGSPGQPGGVGGKGAVMDVGMAGANGGHGGDGGQGGSGGPGGGGPSIGIVWLGKAPEIAPDVTFEIGRYGRGGKSLDATGPDGVGGETYSPDANAPAK
jgi:hypothetical protein